MIGEMENTLQLANCQEITKKLSNVWLEILNLIFLTRFLMLLKQASHKKTKTYLVMIVVNF